MRESTLRILVKLGTVLAVLVFMLFIVLLGVQYAKINSLNAKQSALKKQLAELTQIRENYEAEHAYIESNYHQYVEDYVREYLGWGREGEIKFKG